MQTPQQQITKLQTKIDRMRVTVALYRMALNGGHVPTAAELAHLQTMLDSLNEAEAKMAAAGRAARKQLAFVTQAPNN